MKYLQCDRFKRIHRDYVTIRKSNVTYNLLSFQRLHIETYLRIMLKIFKYSDYEEGVLLNRKLPYSLK